MKRVIYILATTFGLGILSFFVFSPVSHAASFTVTSTADDSAVDPSVSCNTAGDVCTLRSAIEAANAQAGADNIDFNIPGAGVHTIAPTGNFPNSTEAVTIDGSTQPGASCGTLVPAVLPASNTPHTLLIEVNAASVTGLLFTFTSDSTLKGLAIYGYSTGSAPVYASNSSNTTIECNYIGTNTTGNTAGIGNSGEGVVANNVAGLVMRNNLVSGNGSNGITIYTPDQSLVEGNLVGTNADGTGALPNSESLGNTWSGIVAGGANVIRNVVSANANIGISVVTTNTVLQGNYVGLGVTGSPLGNTLDGIYAPDGTNNYTIGGVGAGEGNVVSANGGAGIHIYNQDGTICPINVVSTIYGNLIGTNPSGAVQDGFGNSASGIQVNETDRNSCESSVYQHYIGGDDPGQANTIAGNGVDGVRIFQYINQQAPSTHADVFSIPVLHNIIHSNANLGINLATDSTNNGVANVDVGPNDLNSFLLDYPASYANNYLNHPTINSSSYIGNQLTVNYNFQAPPGVIENDPYLRTTDLVGYRLDFYLNDGTQDGAYVGYSQGKTHLGSFIVNGSESNATHTFTSPIALSNNQNITATATVVWQLITCQGSGFTRWGAGPPYSTSCGD